jgi:hypothetical protein
MRSTNSWSSKFKCSITFRPYNNLESFERLPASSNKTLNRLNSNHGRPKMGPNDPKTPFVRDAPHKINVLRTRNPQRRRARSLVCLFAHASSGRNDHQSRATLTSQLAAPIRLSAGPTLVSPGTGTYRGSLGEEPVSHRGANGRGEQAGRRSHGSERSKRGKEGKMGQTWGRKGTEVNCTLSSRH